MQREAEYEWLGQGKTSAYDDRVMLRNIYSQLLYFTMRIKLRLHNRKNKQDSVYARLKRRIGRKGIYNVLPSINLHDTDRSEAARTVRCEQIECTNWKPILLCRPDSHRPDSHKLGILDNISKLHPNVVNHLVGRITKLAA